MVAQNLSRKEQVLEGYIPEPNSGCWLWTGTVNDEGYGLIKVRGRIIRAHRAAYEDLVGPIPAGKLVCHKCDVRSCINPDHLFTGTVADNARDMGRKGRQHLSRLTAANVLEIRASDLSAATLAKAFGVHPVTIRDIRRRHTWRTI